MSAQGDDPAGGVVRRWAVGVVDREQPFFVLAHDAHPSPVALVGPLDAGAFVVKFLLLAEAAAEVVEAVRQEIDYYLVKLGERDPWAYAIYHTTTLSNALGDVHWGYVDGGEERHPAVRVVLDDDAAVDRDELPLAGSGTIVSGPRKGERIVIEKPPER